MFQKRILSVGCVAVAAVALSSCMGAYSYGAEDVTTDADLQTRLGAKYEVPPSSIEISGRTNVDGTTWFNTRIKGQDLRCHFALGGWLSAGTTTEIKCDPR